MTIFRFREFPVYQDARAFRKLWKQRSKAKLSREEDHVLRPQLWRALDSVVLNIAEGTERYTDKDFSHFLNIALGSVNECVACFDCMLDDGYIGQGELDEGLHDAENLIRQLKGFAASLRKRTKQGVI